MEYLVYDCEIVNCIPPKRALERKPDLAYCGGWTDYVGMGIAVVCAYTSINDRYRTFLRDNLAHFDVLARYAKANDWEVVGFNSAKFDDALCRAHGIEVTTTYDLLLEAKRAANAGTFAKGYKLENFAIANLNARKQEPGALAPELWQQGEYGRVVDYCLHDVFLAKKLFDKRRSLLDPTNGRTLCLSEWIGAKEEVSA